MIVRVADRNDDLAAFGRIVIDAYRALPGFVSDPGYEQYIEDVAARFDDAALVVAFDDGGAPLGCVTYVADASSSIAEFDEADAAGFRMLGVRPAAQGSGAGRALVSWCIEQARSDGKARVIIHSTDAMRRAHRLYESLGFTRDPARDWEPVPALWLRRFVLDLGS